MDSRFWPQESCSRGLGRSGLIGDPDGWGWAAKDKSAWEESAMCQEEAGTVGRREERGRKHTHMISVLMPLDPDQEIDGGAER